MGSFVWERSLWNFRFGTSACELSLRHLSLGTFVLGNFRLETWAQKKSCGDVRLETLALDLWFGIFGLESLGWDPGLGELGSWGWGSRLAVARGIRPGAVQPRVFN